MYPSSGNYGSGILLSFLKLSRIIRFCLLEDLVVIIFAYWIHRLLQSNANLMNQSPEIWLKFDCEHKDWHGTMLLLSHV